jgi:hypothetical protein
VLLIHPRFRNVGATSFRSASISTVLTLMCSRCSDVESVSADIGLLAAAQRRRPMPGDGATKALVLKPPARHAEYKGTRTGKQTVQRLVVARKPFLVGLAGDRLLTPHLTHVPLLSYNQGSPHLNARCRGPEARVVAGSLPTVRRLGLSSQFPCHSTRGFESLSV